jgi:hypothetical protein
MKQKDRREEGEMAYYAVAFKIAGHKTWRFQIYPIADGLEKDWASGPHPKLTAVRKWRFDRLTCEIKEIVQ